MDDPFHEIFALATHDTNALARIPAKVQVAAAGNAVVRGMGSSVDVTYTGLLVGSIIPVRVQYIRATGTTATLVGIA